MPELGQFESFFFEKDIIQNAGANCRMYGANLHTSVFMYLSHLHKTTCAFGFLLSFSYIINKQVTEVSFLKDENCEKNIFDQLENNDLNHLILEERNLVLLAIILWCQ